LNTKRYSIPTCAVAALTVALAIVARSHTWVSAPRAPAAQRMKRLPPVMLWAWERREDLSFIDPGAVGVAVLAGTVYLYGDAVTARPRFQPLIVPPGTRLVAVVRIQANHARPASLSADQRARTVHAIDHLARGRFAALQIDFDATRSQRRFYRDLLFDLRRELPPALPLSITAIASWCIYDDWLATLPIDEAVPMLFRMGPDSERVREYLADGGDFRAGVARRSLGIAADETLVNLPPGRRIYIFSPHAWSRQQELTALGGMKPWR
jgi:Protein of unknown function (DUF3142)